MSSQNYQMDAFCFKRAAFYQSLKSYTPTLRLALWHAFWQHTRGRKTVAGTQQSPTRSLEGSGSQPDPLTPWYNGRAGIIPFRYSPDLLGGKGTSHVGGDKGDLQVPGGKNTGIEPHPAYVLNTE